jgi:hypothetical protein
LYFIATSGVCLIRSGTVGFQKKLQSHKKKPAADKAERTPADTAPRAKGILSFVWFSRYEIKRVTLHDAEKPAA